MNAARHIAPHHAGTRSGGSYDVVTLAGARGAALWHWWLRDENRQAAACVADEMMLEARAMPALPPHGQAPAYTVMTVSPSGEDATDTGCAGVLIDLA